MEKFKFIELPDGDKIIVFDELIPKILQESILTTVDGSESFPWYLLRKVGHTWAKGLIYKDPNVIDGGGFYHSVVDDKKIISKYYDYFKQILFFFTDKTGIEVDEIIRIRLRYTGQQHDHDENTYGPIHVDFTKYSEPYFTLLYYVEDSDGDTILFDKIFDPSTESYEPENISGLNIIYRQKPVQGKGLFFNGHRYHSGNYPIECQTRIVINFDFTLKNN
jgi:hypothetical protein